MKDVIYEVWSDTLRLGRFDTEEDARNFYYEQIDAAHTCRIDKKLYLVESIVMESTQVDSNIDGMLQDLYDIGHSK